MNFITNYKILIISILLKYAIDFYNETNSVDKSLILYPNFGHLLMLENGGQKINDDVAEWIGERVK